jgi:hypothetical protein
MFAGKPVSGLRGGDEALMRVTFDDEFLTKTF